MGADADAIRRLFTPAVIEFCEMRPGLCLESVSEYLFLFRQGVLAPPQNLGMYLDETNTLLRLFAAALGWCALTTATHASGAAVDMRGQEFATANSSFGGLDVRDSG